MQKNILVTGGAGFIGSHLVETLVGAKYNVRVLDNLVSGRREWVHPDAEFVQGDVSDKSTCLAAAQDMDGVVHMAAMSRVGPSPDIAEICTQSNVVGTQNILLAAREHKLQKVVYCGSSTFYGNQPVPHREYETPSELLNFYGLSKQVGEQYCLLFDKLFGVNTIILRYFNVYGPRQPQTGAYALVLGIFLRAWLKNEPVTLHGDGSQRRDFIHVKDVVRAIIMAYESKRHAEVYNVGSGSNTSVKELADMITPVQIMGPPRAGDSKETLADISRIKAALGWEPKISLVDGIKELKERMKAGLEG
jgi:nucleoside-diphosphate-sugar epimerase